MNEKGKQLRTHRQELEMTQTEFAEELGVTKNTVARWERGEQPISKIVELAIEALLIRKKSKSKRNSSKPQK